MRTFLPQFSFISPQLGQIIGYDLQMEFSEIHREALLATVDFTLGHETHDN